jgi:hypothetical protein
MGFIIKSAFWLGVVYSAMPLGQVAAIAAARVEGASSPDLRPSPGSRTAQDQGSAQSLTAADMQPPWMGRERRATSEGFTQSWRPTHPSGYKRVANTHPERQTADD